MSAKLRPLTSRDHETLYYLDAKEWHTPYEIGGSNGSHHNATLSKLIRRGLVERKVRAGWTRNSYLYRQTAAGAAEAKRERARLRRNYGPSSRKTKDAP